MHYAILHTSLLSYPAYKHTKAKTIILIWRRLKTITNGYNLLSTISTTNIFYE